MSDGGSQFPGPSSSARGGRWWLERAALPLIIAGIAFACAWLGAAWSTAASQQSIAAENTRIAAEAQDGQRLAGYADIAAGVTALANASDFTTSAIASGVAGGYRFGYGNYSNGSLFEAGIPGPPTAGQSWQAAYTALDQAISRSEMTGSPDVLDLARALRDKYRNQYYDALLARIDDAVIATYPDPKPTREQLADLLVGVPKAARPSYDPALLRKSVGDLRQAFVAAATQSGDATT